MTSARKDNPTMEPTILPTTTGVGPALSESFLTAESGLSVFEAWSLPAVAPRPMVVRPPSARLAVLSAGAAPSAPVSPSSKTKLSDASVVSVAEEAVLVTDRVWRVVDRDGGPVKVKDAVSKRRTSEVDVEDEDKDDDDEDSVSIMSRAFSGVSLGA
jgi:hypothetical protein